MWISQAPRAWWDSPAYPQRFDPSLLNPQQREIYENEKKKVQDNWKEQRKIEWITSSIKEFVDNNRTPLKWKTWETIFQETNNGTDLSSFGQTNISPNIVNQILFSIYELSQNSKLDRSIIPFPE